MGNAFCSESVSTETALSTEAYLKSLARLGSKTGGSSTTSVGGYDSLQDYGNSMFSKVKGDLIRSIAKDVAGVLKISPSFASSAELKDVIDKFEKVVPDPRKGRKIKVDKKIHIDVCKKIATAINKNYKMDLINVDDSAENICQAVSELLQSLFTGIHSEFITVAGDITRIMQNLNALQDYVDGVNKKLITDLQESSPNEASLVKDAYSALTREIRRQHAYLANLSSGVIGPVGTSLINLLEESKSMPGLTDDLRNLTGSREFSDKLSHMMSGTSSVSHAAYLVDKALKQLGISVAEYKNTKNMKELRKKIYDTLVKKKPNSKDMNKLLIAADVLYRNDLSHEDIAAHLSKKGGMMTMGGDKPKYAEYGEGLGFGDMVSDSLYRDDNGVFKGRRHADKHSIGRTLHKREAYREKLFSSLNQQVRDCYNEIISELYKVGKKIGSDIKISDSLRSFIRQLGYFSGVQPDRKNLHKALSGYRSDVNSEYVKHDYVKALESVKECALECSSGIDGSYFKNISSSIERLIKVITDFNETFTKTLTEVHVEADRPKADIKTTGGVYGSDDDGGMDGGNPMNSISSINALESGAFGGDDSEFKYLVTVKKAIREIEYYFKIANIKSNLKISASQQGTYTDDYENILGEECGMLIDKINSKFKLLTCEDDSKHIPDNVMINTTDGVSTNNQADSVFITPCLAYNVISKLGAPKTDEGKHMWEAFVFALEYIRSAKVEMIEAAQALDLYLSSFTEHLQNNPNDVKDFLKLLEQLEIVAKWFTDKSGDNLVNVFESSVGGLCPLGDMTGSSADKSATNYNEHYYELIKGKASPGNYFDGVYMRDKECVKEFIVRLEKSFKSMRALENVIATFSKLNTKQGSEFKSLMSPGMIFKAFMKYSVATSLAIGKCRYKDSGGNSVSIDLNNAISVNELSNKKFSFLKYIKKLSNGKKVLKIYLRTAHNVNNINNKNKMTHFYDPLHIGNEDDDEKNGYLQTDEIFEMCIKSMVAKVFTVVGAFSLFQRPPNSFINNKSIANTPLRQILGGASSPRIIPEAVELYIRLTLLGEWYRDLFKFKEGNQADKDNIVVSMIPAFDGIWSRFVKVIFVDASNVTDGGYTETFTMELVESINDIYTHYKSKYGADICIKIMENFVAEVNLRYGMVIQDEIDKYLKEKDKGLENNEYDDEDENVDYDILDSKDQFGRKPVPSDRFRTSGYKNTRNSRIKNKRFHNEIIKFRKHVESSLKLQTYDVTQRATKNDKFSGNFGSLGLQYSSVDDLVRQTTKRIKDSNDDNEKKYKIVQSTIMGVERYADVDYDVMLMFHETVINPLTILYTVYRMINHWNRFAISMNVGVGECHLHHYSTIVNKVCHDNIAKFPGNKKYRTGDTHNYLYYRPMDYYYRYSTDDGSFNNTNLMEDTINHIFYLTCDKNPLVEMYFSGDGKKRYPMLSFKKLEQYVIPLVDCVESALVKFRKVLPYNIIQKYENNKQKDFTLGNTDPNDPNVVSLFYIKEHLVNRLIKNKYGAGLSDSNISLKNIWLFLTERNDDNDANSSFSSYNNIFSRFIYWDVELARNSTLYNFERRLVEQEWAEFPIKYIGLQKMTTLTSESLRDISKNLLAGDWYKGPRNEAIRESINSDADNVGNSTTTWEKAYLGHSCIYDYDTHFNKTNVFDNNKNASLIYNYNIYDKIGSEGAFGLIFKFNRLLYHYINLFTDRSSSKIYLQLLEKFANGVNAGEIMKGNAIDDISTNGGIRMNAAFPYNEIGPKSAIFATMAMSIKNIVTNKKSLTTVTVLNYAESNLLNVSEYMKDLMTAYLPIFDKQLNIICAKTDLLKLLLEQTGINVAGPNPGKDLNGTCEDGITSKYEDVKTDGIADVLKEPIDGNNADCKSHLINMLAHLNASAKSLQKCVKDTYKELSDIPLYFETYKNSITDYKNRNGILPLMPLSHVSHLLNNQIRLAKPNDILVYGIPVKYGGVDDPPFDNAAPLDTNLENLYSKHDFNNISLGNQGYANSSYVKNVAKSSKKSPLRSKLGIRKRDKNNSSDLFKSSSNTEFQFYTQEHSNSDSILLELPPTKSTSTGSNNSNMSTASAYQVKPMVGNKLPAINESKYAVDPQQGRRLLYYTYKGLIPHCDVGVGSDEFKFAYGTRGLLSDNSEPNIDLAPGVLGVMDTYNAKVGGAMSYDKRKMTDSFVYSTHLLRFAIDYTYHKTYLGDQDLDKLTGFFIVGNVNENYYTLLPNGYGIGDVGNGTGLGLIASKIIEAKKLREQQMSEIKREINNLSTKSETVSKEKQEVLKLKTQKLKIQLEALANQKTDDEEKKNVDENQAELGVTYLPTRKTDSNLSSRKIDATGILPEAMKNQLNDLLTDTSNNEALKNDSRLDELQKRVDALLTDTSNNEALKNDSGLDELPKRIDDLNTPKEDSKNDTESHELQRRFNAPMVGGVEPAGDNINVLRNLACQTGRHCYNPNVSLSDRAGGIIASNDAFFINTTNITLLVENDNYKQSVYRMLRCILEDSLSENIYVRDRESLRIYNILDANIVPINFHALQREIPLINLFNYSYTFDHLMNEYLGVQNISKKVADEDVGDIFKRYDNGDIERFKPDDKYPADSLVRMLINPRGYRSKQNYINNVWSLMCGNDGLSLNKPKYLSDQLWNKVLLNSLHSRNVNSVNSTYNYATNPVNFKNIIQAAGTKNRGSPFLDINKSVGFNANNNLRLNYSDEITYQKSKDTDDKTNHKHGLNTVTVLSMDKNDPKITQWTQMGYQRYQTVIVRYIEWFVHLQRVMRLLMRDQLSWVNDPIVHGNNAINESVTEYDSNNKFELADFE